MNSLVIKPIITEKSMRLAAAGIYMFDVPKDSNKITIASSVASSFKVEVTKVRISVLKGKTKKFKGVTGKRTDRKRAFVTVKNGQKIAVFEEGDK
jgi:large subunit ribosomal protein L23